MKPSQVLVIISAFFFWIAGVRVVEQTLLQVDSLFRAQILLEVQYLCASSLILLLFASVVAVANRVSSKLQD